MNGEHAKPTSVWSSWLDAATVFAWAVGIVGAWQWARGAFGLGGLLLLISILSLRWPRSIWAPAPRVDLARRWQRWGLLAVCVVAVFFRCYRMDPPGLWGDDAINGLLAFDILDGRIASPFALVEHSFSTFHALTNYFIAGAFALWGADPLTIRVPGIIANFLAVPALYGIVSPLFGPRAAVIAALFFATSPFEIGHAKGLLQNVLGQSFELFALCLLVQGVLRRHAWMLILAAVPLALTLYTYHAAKLVPIIAAFALWQLLRQVRRRGGRVPTWPLVATAMTWMLCTVPAVISYVGQPQALTDRLNNTSVIGAIRSARSLWPAWDSLWRTLAVFHYQQGPIYHWFGIGTDPGLNVVVACLVLHGLVQSVSRWRTPRHALLLGWFLIGIIPGLLSSEAPRGYRILIAAPPIFAWAALPLARLVSIYSAQKSWRLARVACMTMALAVPVVDFNYYFYRVYTSGVFRWFQADAMVEMARTLRAFGPGWTGYIVADNFTHEYESLRFLARAWHLQLRDVANLGDAVPVPPRTNALFMIMRTPLEGMAVLRALYPEVAPDVRYEPVPQSSWFDPFFRTGPSAPTPMTVAFFPVSRQTADSIRGLATTFVAADGSLVTRRTDAQPLLRQLGDLPSLPPAAPQPASVTWSGSLLAPVDGTYTFRLEATAAATVTMGRATILTDTAPRATVALAQGLHRLSITTSIAMPPRLLLWWQRPDATETLIEPQAFFQFPPHGLLAEYTTNEGTRRRVEPYPYHMFFAAPFSGVYSARWSGTLSVPVPGDYQLSGESDRTVIIECDGHSLGSDARLTAGLHALTVRIDGIEGPPRLRLYWQLPNRERELIPPEAFVP